MLRTFGYMALGGIIFFIAGVFVYKLAVAAPLNSISPFLSALVAVLIVGMFTVFGWAIGLILSLASAILHKVEKIEKRVQEFLAPRMAKLTAKIPMGQEGLTIEEFKELIARENFFRTTEQEGVAPTLFSSFKFASRFMLNKVIHAANAIFVSDFLKELQTQGHTRVNVATVERFGREKLVGLVLDYLRTPVSLARLITVLVAAIVLLLPILFGVYS